MRNIFKLLKSKKRNIYADTEEFKFFAKNLAIITKFSSKYKLRSFDDIAFKIIQANLIIKSAINKELIESLLLEFGDNLTKELLLKKLEESNAPYLQLNESKIYIPIYSKGLNYIYLDETLKLLDYPYSELKEEPLSNCIDLFDEYNLALYDSEFTNLLKVGEDKTSTAFYHIEFETIFIINNQGRLDVSIRLFDRHIKNPDYDDLENRLIDVTTNFYSNDRNKFIKSMYMNKFISLKTYKKLSHKVSLRNIKKDRLTRKVKQDEVL